MKKITGSFLRGRELPALSPAKGFLCRLFLLILTIAISPRSGAGANFDKASVGTTSAQFLKVAVDARGVAMGEAYAAMADNASALDWNPTGLIKIKNQSVFMMHSAYLAGSFLDYFAYGQNAGEVGSWGIALKYMNSGSITGTDASGVENGSFTPYDLAASVGFACYITGFKKDPEERFVLGAAGKLVRSKIISGDNTVSADIGLLFPYMFENRFQLAFVAQNIMGSLRFDKEDFPLPMLLRLGSVTEIGRHLHITADIVAPSDGVSFFAMGGELMMGFSERTDIFLRSGFNTRAILDGRGVRNISFGSGLKHGKYYLDYSLSPFGDLGSVHRISAGFNF